MNRKDFQALAVLRIREAQILFRAREFSGAYYLAGYAIECGLKACIAKKVRRHDFPDKKTVADSYSHDLGKLAALADLQQQRLVRAQTDQLFERNWNLVTRGSEEDRYRVFDESAAKEIIDAIIERRHGLMPWVKQRW